MCPDKETLSAYHDGELEGAAAKLIENHLEECVRCGTTTRQYDRLSVSLRSSYEPAFRGDLVASRDHIIARAAIAPPASRWGGSIRIPLPLAAVAAAVIILLTVGLVMSFQRGGRVIGIAEGRGEPASLYDYIERYLNTRRSGAPVIFILPDTAPLKIVSEPTFVRAADYRRDIE